MRYLLDTNFLSETAKPRPDQGVLDWTRAQSRLDFLVSAVSLGEIRYGVEVMPAGRRREALELWLAATLLRQFRGRILPVNEEIADMWGRLWAEGRKRGRPLPPIDGLLVATAAVYDLTLVTRNESDCADRGVPILNPWSD